MRKYIDADKLIKAIEEKGLNCSFALKMERLDTLALIDELQQEQSDVDLEIAAEKAYYVGRSARRLFKEGFKAGAEWMAGQGETKAGEVFDNREYIKFADGTYLDLDPAMKLRPAFKLENGDKVIVQIRRKEK